MKPRIVNENRKKCLNVESSGTIYAMKIFIVSKC